MSKLQRLARACTGFTLIFFCFASFPSATFGWVYPEHRAITLRAIQNLGTRHRDILEKLWTSARTGHEMRLSAAPADATQGESPRTIDYAAFAAIAGDHSCSSKEMVHAVLESDWILDVAAASAGLMIELSKAGVKRYDRINAVRASDLRLLRVDPQYAGRAGANNVHFLLARPYTDTDEKSYIETCLAAGCELNAVGAYAWYHMSALEKARRLSRGNLTVDETNALALSALADEAFALHFLQDVFAAGHVAGTRGSASQRKGTHDYYNESGLEVHTWGGRSIVVKGDAWMRPEDGDRASKVIQASLEQVLEASERTSPTASLVKAVSLAPDTLNTCEQEAMPDRTYDRDIRSLVAGIIRETPVPGLAEGEGELPRFRAEVGPFVGITPGVRAGLLSGAFGPGQSSTGMMGGLDIGVRVGLGLAGVLSESGDGLVAFDFGFRLDAASSASIIENEAVRTFGQIFSAIPSRSAFTVRLRMPFWLIPMDLLLAAPILYPADPESYTTMAAIAGNGGFIPWQSGFATSIGRFQFVLGREVGLSLFGYLKDKDRFLLPSGVGNGDDVILADMRSVQLEFPVLEYRPFRSFSINQTSSLMIQVYGAVDIPVSASDVLTPGGPTPALRSVWQIGVRAAFDWRYYW